MEVVFILLIALAFDLAFREPANSWHPVAWLGKLISLETKASPQKGNLQQLFYGTSTVLVTSAVIVAPVYFLLVHLQEMNAVVYVIAAGLLFKLTFSLRGLRQAAGEVRRFLAQDNLAQARISVGSLVSRDAANLNQDQLMSATVESAAENSCDSFVAPLFYFLLFGVPGAIAYRVVNTFDAMIGYHGEREYLGKFAARLDDAANFIPARITSLMIVLAAWLCKKNMSQAWRTMLRDHKKTESPNAGWTMSAMAGALGVQLEKTGYYQLGNNHHPLSLKTIDASLRIVMVVAVIWGSFSILAEVIHFVAA